MHEAKSWDHNVFTTFTYRDDALPRNGGLRYLDFQAFMHRLRAKVNYKKKPEERKPVRFFCVGEYGSRSARPHYHAILFNLELPDAIKYSGENDNVLFRSAWLDALWTHGQTLTGAVTYNSAAYCARYCLEKVNGSLGPAHYRVLADPETGEMASLEPECSHMSLKPGIGAAWLARYESDIYPDGKVLSNGKHTIPPKFYDRVYKRANPEQFEKIIEQRQADGALRQHDNTRARLRVKDAVAKSRTKQFNRDI